ncbi:type II secretion system F family protein [Kitasatospora sp. NBC_00458]|uniref:type II secretion system F family protein n=1 Tax=Kitasatospora sp. NBC_00458 TaxID=2903568 RepID=UPI002E19B508
MTVDRVELCWTTALCGAATAGWWRLQRQFAGVRRTRGMLGGLGEVGGFGGAGGFDGGGWGRRPRPRAVALLGGRAGRLWRSVRGAPELLLLPGGLAACWVTVSPVPVLAAGLAVLPVRRWRLRRAAAVEAGLRAAAVVELCAALAGELRSGATPEQALHLVTTRIAADRAELSRIGQEPVARLAAGRYGADVPAALRLLAELPGGRGAAAVAACWRVASDGGSGLAAGLDGVAEALRVERSLAEEIAAELAAPRTTIAVLAGLPFAGLLLGAAMGARPLDVLLHTSAGLACLVAGAALEGLGLAWTARIVRSAAEGALEAPPEGGPPVEGRPEAGDGWRCGISRTRVREGRPSGSFRREAMSS